MCIRDSVWTTASQSDLEDMLHKYAAARARRAKAEAEMASMAVMLKPWLEVNSGTDLYDNERGWHAYLQPKRGPKPYDLLTMWQEEPALVERLLLQGCLLVDAKTVQRKGAQVGTANRYAGLEPISYSLQVEKMPS